MEGFLPHGLILADDLFRCIMRHQHRGHTRMLRFSARLQMVAMHSDRHSRYKEGIICVSENA